MASIGALSQQINKIREPQGSSKDNPARTCRDLFLNHPHLESGYYWVDPNLGCNEDAILVFCNADTNETCVGAEAPEEARIPDQPNAVPNATHYEGKVKRAFFSTMRDSYSKFAYVDEATQLTFLRLLSTNARQTVTYYCKNVEGNPIFLASSDVELVDDANSKFNYRIIEDGCTIGSTEWGKSVYEYNTKKTTRLPIVDFAPGPVGAADQQFGLVMGDVCFA